MKVGLPGNAVLVNLRVIIISFLMDDGFGVISFVTDE